MSGDGRGGSEEHVPKLRLDELLGGLQVRIDAVPGTACTACWRPSSPSDGNWTCRRCCAASWRPRWCWWTPSTGRWA